MDILIIDDDPRIRDIFKSWLERCGHNVAVAENGREAIKLQRENPAELIVCDLIMPVQEGIETIGQFKNEYPGVGIIAISGGGKIGSESYLNLAEQLGAWKAFSKPVDMKRFIETVDEWQAGKRAGDRH